MYGSAYTTAQYLKNVYPEIKKVRVVGMNSIREELSKVGIESEGGEDKVEQEMAMDACLAYKVDPAIQGVVVGLDFNFTYGKLAVASIYL